MKDIKKYIIGGVVIVAFVLYLVFSNGNNNSQVASNGSTTTPSTPATNPTTTDSGATGTTPPGNGGSSGGTTPTPTPKPTPTPTPAGQYKDGSYTGPVTDAVYGSMQVKAVVSGGKLTDIQFLQFPNDPGNTTAVNDAALPQLKQEALTAQSANVNIVSGATQSSEAFQQSLAAALATAKN